MTNPVVYVVQDQQRYDKASGLLVPKFPLLAEQLRGWGEVRFLLSPSTAPWKSDQVVSQLERALADYSDEDYLVLHGNPALIGLTVAIASHVNSGHVRMLHWSGKDERYTPIEANMTVPSEHAE